MRNLNFFFQAEDGIRDLVRSRGLGDVYKRQVLNNANCVQHAITATSIANLTADDLLNLTDKLVGCLLYTSDAADDIPCVDLGGRRIIKKKNNLYHTIFGLPYTSAICSVLH